MKTAGRRVRVAYVGLGANLGDPPAQLRAALESMAALGRIAAISPFYRSAPMGPADQPPFCNAVCRLETDLEPEALMQALLGIELKMGRRRSIKWGPRTIDLDLLHVDTLKWSSASLQLPHPGIASRNFVLAPLLDVAEPDLQIPGLASLSEALRAVGHDGLERWPR